MHAQLGDATCSVRPNFLYIQSSPFLQASRTTCEDNAHMQGLLRYKLACHWIQNSPHCFTKLGCAQSDRQILWEDGKPPEVLCLIMQP